MRIDKCFKKWIYLNQRQRFISVQLRLLVFAAVFILLIYLYKIICQQELAKEEYTWLRKHNNLSYFNNKVTKGNYNGKCSSTIPVLIAVISAPPNFSARNAIRISWGKQLPKEWKLLFFVGFTPNRSLEEEVEKEKNAFEDVIMINVQESYINLTLKSYLTFLWVHHHCQHSRFLFKVDDDVYLSPFNIKHLIQCSSLAMNKPYDPLALKNCEDTWDISNLMGHFIDKKSRKYINYIVGGYLYKNVKPDRNPYSKWYLSKSLYRSDDLPDFLSGTAYFLSTNLLSFVLEAVAKIPSINLEDLYFTGLVMSKELNLKLSQIKGWNRFRPLWDDTCSYSKLVTAHGLSPKELISITNEVGEVGNSCTWSTSLFASFNDIISYFIPRYKL